MFLFLIKRQDFQQVSESEMDNSEYDWNSNLNNNYNIHNRYVETPTGDISQSYIKGVASIYAPDIYVSTK